jgi:sec-independent protein translocase protein TatB
VFGFSFGELVVLVVVAIVVIGPKDMPRVLRKLGQWAGQARRMASDMRAQSGIDDVLKNEGLRDDINEIRKLARGEIEGVAQAARIDAPFVQSSSSSSQSRDPYAQTELVVDREREFPREGADSYRALPDTAIVYAETLPKSPLAKSPLYLLGDANAILPPEPEPAAGPEPEAETPAAEDAPAETPESPLP